MERLEIPVGEFTFDARAAGPADGELVLLLHGFPETSHEWRAQLPALAQAGYRAVAPDQRGYSPRARPEGVENYRVDKLAADVLAIADWMGGHQFHLVGHDWGAMVAWQLAGHHQERLRSLTPVSVPHPAAFARALQGEEQQQRSSYVGLFQQEGKAEEVLLANDAAALKAMLTGAGDDDDIARYARIMQEPGALTAALNWYRAIDLAMVPGMGPIPMPTMFVWSTNDLALGRDGAEATGEFVEGPYRFEVLEGVTHWVPEQAAGEFTGLRRARL